MLMPRFTDASRDAEMKGATRQVYHYFVVELIPGEWMEKKRSVIALDLGLSERAVDDAIAWLVQRRYIEAGKRTPGSPQSYKLVWKREAA